MQRVCLTVKRFNNKVQRVCLTITRKKDIKNSKDHIYVVLLYIGTCSREEMLGKRGKRRKDIFVKS